VTHYIRGATVYHIPAAIYWTRGEAEAECGVEGEPVEADPDDEEICANCRAERGDE